MVAKENDSQNRDEAGDVESGDKSQVTDTGQRSLWGAATVQFYYYFNVCTGAFWYARNSLFFIAIPERRLASEVSGRDKLCDCS